MKKKKFDPFKLNNKKNILRNKKLQEWHLATLKKLSFLTVKEQISKKWLGGGKKGGAAKALFETSKFLKEQKKIPAVLKNYGKTVNSSFAKAAAK